jgi:hypothetical protein
LIEVKDPRDVVITDDTPVDGVVVPGVKDDVKTTVVPHSEAIIPAVGPGVTDCEVSVLGGVTSVSDNNTINWSIISNYNITGILNLNQRVSMGC